jgi:hypothetical protein
MTDLPSDEKAVELAAAKRKVTVDYLLKILRLARSPTAGIRVVEQVEQIIRVEADERRDREAPPS